MNNPVGSPPLALTRMHGTVHEAESVAREQARITRIVVERLQRVFADGRVNENDRPDLEAAAEGSITLASLARDQKSRLHWCCVFCREIAEHVRTYRLKIQEMRKAAVNSGPSQLK